MIPFIRSLSELMAITKSRDIQNNFSEMMQIDSWPEDSGQRKRYVKSMSVNKVELPDLPKSIRHKWFKKKEKLSRFFEELDYEIQIQSSYDLTLQERQNNNINKDAA
mgnify:CR=1 FL=1|tara:strand:+ start:616 stop:936 length:321 start_codon:yes stop_codon:yes gene_type:complete